LAEISTIIGHPIKTSLDLTQAEYQQVMYAIANLGKAEDEPF
jgi:hypothetical protein